MVLKLSKCPVTLAICQECDLFYLWLGKVSVPSPGPAHASKDAEFVQTLRVQVRHNLGKFLHTHHPPTMSYSSLPSPSTKPAHAS